MHMEYFKMVALRAYRVSTLGECLPNAWAFSNLATDGALVPIRSATCACVNPSAFLANTN